MSTIWKFICCTAFVAAGITGTFASAELLTGQAGAAFALLTPTTTHNVTPQLIDYPGGKGVCPDGSISITDAFGNITTATSTTYTVDGQTFTVTVTPVNTDAGTTYNFSIAGGTITRFYIKGGSGSAYLRYDYAPPVAGATNTGPVTSDTGLHAGVNDQGKYQGISHADFCVGPPITFPLVAEKSAAGTYDRTVSWEIVKTANPTTHTGTAGNTAGTSTWTIVATKTQVESEFQVTGTITISNRNANPVTFDVADELSDGTDADVDCDAATAGLQNQNIVVPGGSEADPGEVVCTYVANPSGRTATSNTVTVTSDTQGVGGDTDTEGFTFVETLIGHDSVTVDDDRDTENQFPTTISTTASFDYTETFTCSSDPGHYENGTDVTTYPNRATIKSGQTLIDYADASVVVTCTLAALTATKTAAGTFNRVFDWNLTKTVDVSSFSGIPGETFTPNWTVTVTRSLVESGYSVAGAITINNPTAVARTFTVADQLSDGTVATVDCNAVLAGNQNSGIVAANGTATCSYSASPSTGTATLNTATISTLGNPDVTATAAVSFSAVVTGDASVQLTDLRNPLNRNLTGEFSITYPETFACPTDPSLYDSNGTHTFSVLNTARILGAVTDRQAQATVNVTCRALRYEDETATGFGPGWPDTRNWFMYTPCTTQGSVDLIAGQHYDAGDITFSACGSGGGTTTITITLAAGFRWGADSANLKIHPMNTAPTKYVQPGKFAYKFEIDPSGQTATVTVPTANYYGIHASVRRLILD